MRSFCVKTSAHCQRNQESVSTMILDFTGTKRYESADRSATRVVMATETIFSRKTSAMQRALRRM
jgi:hypothetical protein